MNNLNKFFARLSPKIVISNKARKIMENKPTGFHPIKKYEYRKTCGELLDSLIRYLQKSNKKPSKADEMLLKQLESETGGK